MTAMTAMTCPGGTLELIGNTPLVRLRRLSPRPGVEIWAKLEGHNPGGSVKDRIARSMIEAAEAAGQLTRGKTILEATSGNTGIGLALVGAVKGYPVKLAMSEAVSQERRQILAALGAEFLLTPAKLGTDGAIEVVYRLVRREPGRYFIPDQYNNPHNPLAHYHGTAAEILLQTDGRLTHFVAAMGTSGTLMGTSARLKEHDPAIRVIGVEPYLGHKIQGLKNLKEAYRPGIFDKAKLDRKVNVLDEEAFEATRLLAREEGLFVGMSSGAALHAALQLARTLERGVIVVLLPDGGERYLSTSLFQLAQPTARREVALELHDTLCRARRPFVPLVPGKASVYSCGPTLHADPTIGVWRRVLTADLLRRYLEHLGLEVKHVMNLTDIDDKTIAESERQGVPIAELTTAVAERFFAALDLLGVKRAWRYPRASEHVDDMIAFARRLVERGFAYEKLRSVYFDLGRFPRYGALSGLDLSKIRLGSTVDLDEYEKADPRDFTLFKRATLAEMARDIFYETEWGNVRPGLHVECATMATRFLGEEFDLHTSGSDLLFPHNENEIAQCEALHGRSPARYWLHSELVLVEGKKMSRSAGNATTLADVQALGYSPRELRYLILGTHYRQPLAFAPARLEAARAALRRLDLFVCRLRLAAAEPPAPPGDAAPPREEELPEGFARLLLHELERALDADLNVPMALGLLFTAVRRVNPLLARRSLSSRLAGRLLETIRQLDGILGIFDLQSPLPQPDDPAVTALLCQRKEARQRRDYAAADQLRDRLRELGYTLEDTPGGTICLYEAEAEGEEEPG